MLSKGDKRFPAQFFFHKFYNNSFIQKNVNIHEMAWNSSVSSEQTAAVGHTKKDGFLVDVKAIHTFSKLNV